VRDSTPAIVEIKRYLDARPHGAILAGLEHLDERYVKAVGYAVIGQFLKLDFPETGTGTVAATAIRRNEQRAHLRVGGGQVG
jgi:FAD/FMN-containing dehydrogenase